MASTVFTGVNFSCDPGVCDQPVDKVTETLGSAYVHRRFDWLGTAETLDDPAHHGAKGQDRETGRDYTRYWSGWKD